jgi:hypothetical protein
MSGQPREKEMTARSEPAYLREPPYPTGSISPGRQVWSNHGSSGP